MQYEYLDNHGTFRLEHPEQTSYLYFPIANESGLKSSVTPLLGGDAKEGQNTFLLQPVSSEELHNNRSTRNFWCRIKGKGIWSATGVSAEQEANRFDTEKEGCVLEAGLMWQKLIRTSKENGLRAEVTSFVPVGMQKLELMVVTLTNPGEENIELTPIAAIPLFARSADNIRDHRHVTSLLHRIAVKEEGIFVTPTLTFDERGHKENSLVYGVMGFAEDGKTAQKFHPVVEDFIGEGGSFLNPEAVRCDIKGYQPGDSVDGYEAMGGIEFAEISLAPGVSATYIVQLGIGASDEELLTAGNKYKTKDAVEQALAETKAYWIAGNNVAYETADKRFDQWMYWVDFQPVLRRIYGCSFLPHHDYGKGGRGWRDLWQDCLALLVMNPSGVRQMLLDNFEGVRMDGSNATIIGSKQGEFIADRNNITRVWMDHGVWPLMTTELYIRQTGDIGILQNEMPYFKDRQIFRGEKKDDDWDVAQGNRLRKADGEIYCGSVLEHLLVQHLTAFYDVGVHNTIRLRGADWNDAIDMAAEQGESVAFTAAYAGNLETLADLVRRQKEDCGVAEIRLARELMPLLQKDHKLYADVQAKRELLERYCEACKNRLSGESCTIAAEELTDVLTAMAKWMKEHIRKQEWVGDKNGMHWYNGYYDNHGRQVEGEFNEVRMMLTSQVFTVMSGVATDEQTAEIVQAVDKYLYDEKIGGYRLNTDFHELKLDMGRMFGFAYGHKENGAVFCHMAVMYANALYQRGFVKEGHKVIDALYRHGSDFEKSRIYPGIPEYFNQRGRGMYHYLTGAASWLMLTTLTEMFGVKGAYGKVRLEPKLLAEQFDAQGDISVECVLMEKKLHVIYHNPKHLEYGAYKIAAVTVNGQLQEIRARSCEIATDTLSEDKNRIEVMLV